MNLGSVAFICWVMAFGAASSAFAEPACHVGDLVPANALTFAKVAGQDAWHGYRSIGEVPVLDTDGGTSAQLWQSNDGSQRAYFVEPGEDFEIYTRYCFDKVGQLVRVGFEVRTAWGWGYRLEGQVIRSTLHSDSAEFFNTKNEKPTSRPESASDISEVLKPTLYLNVNKLPFARLLAHSSAVPPK